MAPKTTITPRTFDTIPGQFAIRTKQDGTFVSARNLTEVDALITPSQTVEASGYFIFEGYLTGPTHIKTFGGGYYVIAEQGGNFGAANELLTFSTIYTELPTTNWGFFEIHGPDSGGLFTITTLTGNYVTAVDGGGLSTRAFHTDAVTASTWEQFYITKIGNLGSNFYYAIRPVFPGYGGNTETYARYLSATAGGGLAVQNAVEMVYGLGVTTAFKFIAVDDGLSYALQTSNGVNYVTADQGGGIARGSATDGNLQTDRTIAQEWEQFTFTDQGDGTFTIKTWSGFLVGVDEGGDISTRIGSADAAPTIGYTARFELIMLNPVY